MLTVFNVKSNRIHDIEIEPGTTVGQLREILRCGGYDVVDAKVIVDRFGADELYGQNNGYALKEGDCVRFITKDYDCPGLEKEISKTLEDIDKEVSQCLCNAEKPEACKCESGFGCDGISVTKSADGSIVIKIARD